jgi:anti-sigma B factor antagonist
LDKILEVNVRTSDDVVMVDLVGDIDLHVVPLVKEKIEPLIAEGKNKIVMDMAKVKYLSSAGIGALLRKKAEAREAGGDIKFINLSRTLRKTFELLGISGLLEVYDSEKEAAASFK